MKFHYKSNVPVTGLNVDLFSVVTTQFSSDEPIDPEIIGRSLLHELMHFARKHSCIFEKLDDGQHCYESPCLLNSGSGTTQAEIIEAIMRRPLEPECNFCRAAWNTVSRCGVLS